MQEISRSRIFFITVSWLDRDSYNPSYEDGFLKRNNNYNIT